MRLDKLTDRCRYFYVDLRNTNRGESVGDVHVEIVVSGGSYIQSGRANQLKLRISGCRGL